MIYNQIDTDFFKSLNKYSSNKIVTPDTIYEDLTHYGVKKDDYNKILNIYSYKIQKDLFKFIDEYIITKKYNFFHNWCEYYKTNPNITVHTSIVNPNFCQFISNDKTSYNSREHITVLIPLDYDHIKLGVKIIFDFLVENNISHASKVGSRITNDNISIDLTNEDDVNKLINFVNSQKYLQEGLIRPNPFYFTKDGISLLNKSSNTFNEIISTLLSFYINTQNSQSNSEKISLENFYIFVRYYIFNNDKTIEALFNCNNNQEMKKYKQLIEIILNTLIDDFDFEDFIYHYKYFSIEDKLNQFILINYKSTGFEYILSLLKSWINGGNINTQLNSSVSEIKTVIMNSLDVTNIDWFNDHSTEVCTKYIEKIIALQNSNENNNEKKSIYAQFKPVCY